MILLRQIHKTQFFQSALQIEQYAPKPLRLGVVLSHCLLHRRVLVPPKMDQMLNWQTQEKGLKLYLTSLPTLYQRDLKKVWPFGVQCCE